MENTLLEIADDLDALDDRYRRVILLGLDALAEKVETPDWKLTAGELDKLMQMEAGLRTAATKEIRVSWGEPGEETELSDEE